MSPRSERSWVGAEARRKGCAGHGGVKGRRSRQAPCIKGFLPTTRLYLGQEAGEDLVRVDVVLVVAEVDDGLGVREPPGQHPPPRPELALHRSAHLRQGLCPLRRRVCRQQIRQALDLGQPKATVGECPLRELALPGAKGGR